MGQRIALHAGKGWDERAEQYLPPEFNTVEEPSLIRLEGAIVGTAVVSGWFASDEEVAKTGKSHEGLNLQKVRELVKDRFFFGPYGWVLEDVQELIKPVACRGKQGLWHVPDAALAEMLQRQL